MLERSLATREMTIAEREIKEAELEAIKRELAECEDMLKLLQKQNRHTPSLAGLFIFLCVAVFLIYSVMTNTYQ